MPRFFIQYIEAKLEEKNIPSTTANATNLLYDASLGTVITKLKAGIGI